ncbi:hypothetical protein M413DRAFT_448844 [Hebeloma cylindrosporum]|uniref:Exoribonuclease phosphorolytic domain-containing protein n=1 Tax=Hebeloma cylindrosporum TaxID=76867 RepID=A0A0C3BZQ6_HEBCY|nr:hypothetical protein M413DRAFT_448844 [Hebeloma cylindrosporum h7]
MSATPRRDGRTADGIRNIRISYDGLARVDGSARFSFGGTAALASLSGPIEVRLAAEKASKATFEVNVRPLSNVPATESKSLATAIRSSLEPSLILTKNPRSLVQLVVQSLSYPTSKDALSAAMINASSLALLNAGSVPMRGLVAAVAVGRVSGGQLVLDPSEEEAVSLEAGGTFAFMFADGIGRKTSNSECVWTNWKSDSGGYDQREIFQARELARTGARAVYEAMRTDFEKPRMVAHVHEQVEVETKSEDHEMEI